MSLPKIEGQPPGWDNLVLPAIDACVMDSDSITPAADESDDEDPGKI